MEQNHKCRLTFENDILYTYNCLYYRYRQEQLFIYTNNQTNKISDISYEIL